MTYFKKLVGDRIYLSPRSAEPEAVEKFTEWMNDFQVTDYIGRSEQLVSLLGEKKFLEENASPEATFAIVTLDGDKLIGTVGLDKIKHVDRSASLGIFIGDADYRSKGYGTEAIRLLLDFGFNYLNLRSIELSVLDVNVRAQKCYEKCGFKKYGTKRKSRFINGKFHDEIFYDILKEEFTETYIRNKNV